MLLVTLAGWIPPDAHAGAEPAAPAGSARAPEMRSTPGGAAFALIEAAVLPAPTLLVCAKDAISTLSVDPYRHTGTLLHAEGWNVIALDLPCHGADQREGERPELEGWRDRVERGENIVTPWQARVNDVLKYLVNAGMAEPNRFVADGTSRGGYMACQAAAGNPAIRAVAAYGPVTNLMGLREFEGMENSPLVRELALTTIAPALAERPIWITIGSQDTRVGTDYAIAFARSVTAAADQKGQDARLMLRVTPTKGHSSTNEDHAEAAQWIRGLE
ncbi:MAG: prolyl oligopeptidase family serine peptidase [Candidatus Hydrogenedentes bacterium]|nr:prolyl oligopeptidase family serine peptidase [Candidatus Hydrogenedentota bacterium]